jgi:hypothetical protein
MDCRSHKRRGLSVALLDEVIDARGQAFNDVERAALDGTLGYNVSSPVKKTVQK